MTSARRGRDAEQPLDRPHGRGADFPPSRAPAPADRSSGCSPSRSARCGPRAIRLARAADPCRDRGRRFLPGCSRTPPCRWGRAFRQTQQRPITARDHVAALFLLDGGKSQIEMEEREHAAARSRPAMCGGAERRVHAVSIRISAKRVIGGGKRRLAAGAGGQHHGAGRPLVAGRRNDIAGLAVTTTSAMPAILRASSAPWIGDDLAGLGKGIALDHRHGLRGRQSRLRRRVSPSATLDRGADEIHAGIRAEFRACRKSRPTAAPPVRSHKARPCASTMSPFTVPSVMPMAAAARATRSRTLACDLGRQMAGQIAAILDEEGRIAFQIFVIAVGKARRVAASADDHAIRSRPAGPPDIAPPSPARWANGSAPA